MGTLILGESYSSSEDEKKKGREVLKLQVLEREVNSGSIPITWCVDSLWLEENKDKLSELKLHICTFSKSADGRSTEWRGAVKLEDKGTYVTFLRPGENRIAAVITSKFKKEWLECWLYDGGYKQNLISYPIGMSDWVHENDNRFNSSVCNIDKNRNILTSYLDVDVPSEVFADPPWKWEEKWVNFLFSSKCRDQCAFRRKRLFAYTIQPFMFLFLYSFALMLWVFHAFAGHVRNNPYTYSVKNPLSCDLITPRTDVGFKDSLFWSKKLPKVINIVNILGFPITLCVGVFCFFLLPPLIGLVVYGGFLSIWAGVYIIWGLAHLALCIFSLYLKLVRSISTFIVDKVFPFSVWDKVFSSSIWNKKPSLPKNSLRISREVENLEQNIDLLSCGNNEVIIKKMEDLPKRKQTLSLRFKGLKGKVCKPFAQ